MKMVKTVAAAILLVFIIANLSELSQAVSLAMTRCLNIIIPSLFIMMVVSRYIVSNELLAPLEKLLRPLSMITGMNERMITVFILGNTGGYPIGALMLTQMVNDGQITKKDAAIASSYCFGAGPAFVVGAIGLCVYNSSRIGYLMFISCVIANLIACILYNRICKTSLWQSHKASKCNSSYSITDAITDSGKSLFTMCAVIIAFSLVTVVIDKISVASKTDLFLITPLFEVTNAASARFALNKLAPLAVIYVSLGGICVWLQNATLVRQSYSIFLSLALRIPISLLSGAIFSILYNRFSDYSMAANADFNGFVVNIDNFLPSICLIIMIFLLINKKRLAFL